MYNRLAAPCITNWQHHGSGLPYNISSSERVNTKAMTNEITQDQGDNPYKRVVLNNVYKVPESFTEMKNWSIFSDNIRYVQHDQMTTQNLNFGTPDYRNHKDIFTTERREKRGARH